MKAEEFAGIFEKLYDKFYGWVESLVVMSPNIVAAIIVVGAFAFASRWIGKGAYRLLLRVSKNQPISELLGTLTRFAVMFLGIFIALGVLDLDRTVTSILAGVGVVGLALGFAFQDIAANFMSGFIMALNRPFDVGDLVETASVRGEVIAIELRATQLRTLDGLSVIIPNKDVFQNPIVNYTRTEERRLEVSVGVAYNSDLTQVRKIVLGTMEKLPNRDSRREPECLFESFGGSSIDLVARIWLTDSGQGAYSRTLSEAVIAIKAAFDESGITIPFPIRTLDFGASVVGGVNAHSAALTRDASAV